MNVFKDNKLFFYIAIFVFVFLFLLVFFDFDGVNSHLFGKNSLGKQSTCVVQGCHGAGVVCGARQENVICYVGYKLGDGCRALARCGQVSGTCGLTNDAIVGKCADCVFQNCYNKNGSLAEACESVCVQQALDK